MEHRLTTFDDLRVGQSATLTRTIRDADVAAFAALTGDSNPIHVDEAFARRTFFGGLIAHGMLTASLLSTLIGMLLPGTGAIYRSQTLEFVKAVRPGDELTVRGEIREVDREQNVVRLDCNIERADGQTVLRGTAVISLILGFRDSRG
jgi:acyl dehydratase